MKKREILRKLLASEKPIMAPGAYNGLTAKLVEQAGFSVVYMTGYGTTANILGKPDYGYLTLTEMVQNAKNMGAAVDIPLIADADTGYGNIINVQRTVQEYELAGIAAIHLEDQVFPKRCGHMEGKQVVSVNEHAQKIKAAVSTRTDDDFLIIARTDARAVNGFEDAIERGKAYADAGADILFIEAPQSIQEMEAIHKAFPNIPLVANMVEHGKTPLLPIEELGQIGFKLVLYPVSVLFAATFAVKEMLETLSSHGTIEPSLDRMTNFPEFNQLIGLDELMEWEKNFK
ncbi:isocitrate lyase/PEP mutase family protein [Alkalihalobacterium alkalinitrilicum]|uniref:isocitrate lyase/PEP mutase family protein n=1 Tax=Alkalihalobacterium alkalinitrilicum TaxID=427920 RepID=UPI000994AF04|nr:oxaloacetate decarboxylase [Alkalihalobacterium alkalinitrilicum]